MLEGVCDVSFPRVCDEARDDVGPRVRADAGRCLQGAWRLADRLELRGGRRKYSCADPATMQKSAAAAAGIDHSPTPSTTRHVALHAPNSFTVGPAPPPG